MWKVTASSFASRRASSTWALPTCRRCRWNLAEPLMEDLVEEVRESSSAAVLDGLDIVYAAARAHPQDHAHQPGRGLAPACSLDIHGPRAAGQPARRRTAKPPSPPCPCSATPAHTATDLPTLLERIRQARTQGWCLVNQELEEGLISIAAPLTNRLGQTVAASTSAARPTAPAPS